LLLLLLLLYHVRWWWVGQRWCSLHALHWVHSIGVYWNLTTKTLPMFHHHLLRGQNLLLDLLNLLQQSVHLCVLLRLLLVLVVRTLGKAALAWTPWKKVLLVVVVVVVLVLVLVRQKMSQGNGVELVLVPTLLLLD
jgi:magnesium-transporting ATPase (P-type)